MKINHILFCVLLQFAGMQIADAQQVSLHEDFASLPSGRVWVRDSGGVGNNGGKPVVFLHPASGNSAVWEKQIPVLLAAGFRFIAYDRVGSGKSVRDVAAIAAPRPNASEELQALLDYLKLDRVYLVGVAGGGGTALQFALNNPQRVLGLVLANSIGNVADPGYTEMGRWLRPSPQFDALPVEFRELGPSYRAINKEGVARWLMLSGQTEKKQATAQALPQTEPRPAIANPATQVTLARLETIKFPTLLMTGDADLYTPPSVLRLFAERIKHADMVIVPETGHASYWESPDVFNKAVLAFLRKQ